MSAFAEVLPRLRRRTQRDLRLPGLPREKVLATEAAILGLLQQRLLHSRKSSTRSQVTKRHS